MEIGSKELIDQLIKNTKELITFGESLNALSDVALNHRLSSNSWSVLECLQHLNLYGDFYLSEIARRMLESTTEPSDIFRSGMLGNYFANSMLPKEKLNKMNTFKSMNPIHSNLNRSVLATFLEQQDELLRLLELARTKNLNRIKTNISIGKWIKLKLGDVFRIVVYHELRHMQQAKRIIAGFK